MKQFALGVGHILLNISSLRWQYIQLKRLYFFMRIFAMNCATLPSFQRHSASLHCTVYLFPKAYFPSTFSNKELFNLNSRAFALTYNVTPVEKICTLSVQSLTEFKSPCVFSNQFFSLTWCLITHFLLTGQEKLGWLVHRKTLTERHTTRL